MALVRFPSGKLILGPKPFSEAVFSEVDAVLGTGACPEGAFEIEAEDTRLVCLILNSAPYLAGLLENNVFSRVPLSEFALRARDLEQVPCKLVLHDVTQVGIEGVHYYKQPVLRASTELVNLEHIVVVLGKEGEDAVLALERDGARTTLFLKDGRPSKLYFGNPADDVCEGSLEQRFFTSVYDPKASEGVVEVFKHLAIERDLLAGTTFLHLARAAKPPPAKFVVALSSGNQVLKRPFMAPSMTVGRDRFAELFFDNLSVSRRHAKISWTDGQFVVEDLGSANGTLVNGHKTMRVALASGDRIGVGNYELMLVEPEAEEDPRATKFVSPEEAFASTFLVGKDLSLEIEKEIRIGSALGVDVRARGWRVKPLHACIKVYGPGNVRLTCFGKATAMVNGARVQAAQLKFGDKIMIGRDLFWLAPMVRPRTS